MRGARGTLGALGAPALLLRGRRRRSHLRLGITALSVGVYMVLLAASPVSANGGTIQVSDAAAGPYSVTAYTDPTPIMTGVVDVSVLVEQSGSSDLVQDGVVNVTAQALDGSGGSATFPATHDQATNKLFYAANVDLPTPGAWHLDVQVQGAAGTGDVGFNVDVSQAGLLNAPLTIPLLVLFPAAVVLWWWHRTSRTGRHRPATESQATQAQAQPSLGDSP